MMDWTDRHCRYFHRQISRHTRLYTEMVTTGALLHGDLPRHLDFSPDEQPLALQVGGSEPADLAQAARLARQWGYAELNLNCGCPSERVQRGAFGACLMAEPALVRDGVAAMRAVLGNDLPVTVKHRIGIDRVESYDFVRDFVGTVAEAGCSVFIVHARNAWLQGLSPKENRELPPLRYGLVQRLKLDFPALTLVLNGGVTTDDQIEDHLDSLDGVMVGREAYHHPSTMAAWDARFWGAGEAPTVDDDWRLALEQQMLAYIEREAAGHGTPWTHTVRHMLGLWNGQPGARRWRQVWSDHRLKALPVREVARQAQVARLAAVATAGSLSD
jgi:tRNA-dihydrouridine synthase A